MAQLSLDAIRSVTPGIGEHDLIGWFQGGALIAALPEWARRRLHPLIVGAGFDETRPIHVHQHEGTPGVTLYQEPEAVSTGLQQPVEKIQVPLTAPSKGVL